MPKLKNWGGARPGSGRPIVGKEKRQITTIALEPVLLAALERYAKQAGLSRNEAVNRLLSECLLSERTPGVQMPLIDTPAPPVDDFEQALAALDADPELTPRPTLAPCLADWLKMTDLDFGEALANELSLKGFNAKENDFARKVSDNFSQIYGNVLVNFLVSHDLGMSKTDYNELNRTDENDRRRSLLAFAGITL